MTILVADKDCDVCISVKCLSSVVAEHNFKEILQAIDANYSRRVRINTGSKNRIVQRLKCEWNKRRCPELQYGGFRFHVLDRV